MGHGFDPFVKQIGDENNPNKNCGEGKQYPFGPACTGQGKTPLLLLLFREWQNYMALTYQYAAMLDQSTGLCPVLLLDGHRNRFELEFLEYISTIESKWFVDIRLT